MATIDDTLESFISAEDDNAGIPFNPEEVTQTEDLSQDDNEDAAPVSSDYPTYTSNVLEMLLEAAQERGLLPEQDEEETANTTEASKTSDEEEAQVPDLKKFLGLDSSLTPEAPSNQNAEGLVDKTLRELLSSTDNMKGSDYNIAFNPDGSKKAITIKGDGTNTEFQSLGKYTTPEQFLAKDPETFKRVNPGLWAKMQAEQAAAAQVTTEFGINTFKGIEAQMDLISKEPDPIKRQKALSDLQVQVAQTASGLAKDTRILAEQQSGFTALQAQLKASEARDRAHPEWQSHLTDSRETLALRKQAMAAQASSAGLSNRLLKENPLIAGMTAKIGNFLKTEQARVSKDLVASDNIARAIEAEKMTISDDTAKYLTYLNPKINNDPAEAAKLKLSLKADPMKKNLIAELAPFYDPAFKESDILPLAISGNDAAVKIATNVQAEKTGADPRKTEEDIKLAQRFVRDPAYFIEQMKPLAVKDKALAELLQSQSPTGAAILDKGKEAEARRMMQRASLVDAWMTARKTNIATNNVESWNGDKTLRSSPGIAQAIDEIKTIQPGKPISLDTLVGQYVAKAPKELQADRLDEIRSAMNSYIEKNNKGLYGNIDITTMNNKLRVSQGITSGFSATAGKYIDYGLEAASMLNSNPGFGGFGVR